MEVKLKERLRGHGPYGMIKNVEVMYQRISKMFSAKAPGATVAGSIPYEVSEACKAQMLEFERKRSQALAEAQRMRNRMI